MALSEERLEVFLKHEIEYMGRGQYKPITLPKILAHSTPMACARLIHRELPLRFATRIKQIESSSDQWRDIPCMQRIHKMFSESFRKLRLVELDENDAESSSNEFMAVVQDISWPVTCQRCHGSGNARSPCGRGSL
ncbi:unnamed protein product [Prorocentrum cordatum]|uniref:Branched-chain alpha-ketoacid dehydrogenase kinase/Pyruvate dehydrogenase kinase N-terminal domain-containing protein n=1 Tax=Prorocentrum cordatum TaxID=2364126 RepID=A0ABN9TCS7_9DINO|nr:unnamed protein product [Polarella glacialis]